MKIYDFIEAEALKASEVAAAKYRGLLRPLKAYLGEESDTPLLSTITPRWQKKFRQWMAESYPATLGKEKLSEHSIKRHLDSFKAVCRQGILAGLLPNVRLFNDAADGAGEYRCRRKELVARGPVERLLNYFPTDARLKQAADYVLLSVFLAGMGWKGLAALTKSDFANGKLRLAHLGNTAVALPATVDELIRRNMAGDDSQRLLRPAESKVVAEAATLCRRFGLPDPQDAEATQTLWLRMAAEASTAHSAIHDTIDVLTGTLAEAPEHFAEDLAALMDAVASDNGEITKRWYVMVCVKGAHGTEMADRLIGSAIVADAADLYAPQDIQFKKHRNGNIISFNNPVVDRLLFVRQPLPAVHAIQRKLRSKGIFLASNRRGAPGERRLSQVPQSQIDNLKRFLGVRDDRRFYHSGVEAVGRRVRVTDGMYKGCEGVIVEFQAERPRTINLPSKTTDSAGEAVRYFGIRILGESFALTPSIESSLLEPIDI